MHSADQSCRFVVFGHVQGVGFRNFVCGLADQLAICGEVWNRRDGTVEMLVAGQPDALERFRLRLMAGPGRPERVDATPTLEPVQAGMRIGPTR